jgi:hypothetical protein
MIKINYPSEESLTLALELLGAVSNEDFSEVSGHDQSYFLTGTIYDFFNELKAYLASLSSSKERLVRLEAFETLSGMAYDKLKIDLGLVN